MGKVFLWEWPLHQRSPWIILSKFHLAQLFHWTMAALQYTYLLTYLLHGAQSFLRSQPIFS